MPALLLGEPLLRAVARPGIFDDPRAQFGGDAAGLVRRAGIDHHQIVREMAHRPDRLADPVSFVLGDDEDGDWEHVVGAAFQAA